jgi:superfamily II DNA or RNA helicase
MSSTLPDATLQQLPHVLAAQTRIVARGWPWRLQRARAGTGCVAVDLDPGARGAPPLATLLYPFDSITPASGRQRWRRVSGHRLNVLLRSLAAWAGQPLASVTSIPARPWPHQLAPALALVQGHSTRMLVADAVGLGKTLTAAVVLSEVSVRGVGSRALILVPAGLRDQWRDELLSRAGIVADIVDASALATRRDGALTRPNPWAGPGVSIVSLDFAKQPAVLAGLLASPWDVLILDEAHVASGESARAAAVSRIAAISRVVIALTATPHSGDTRAFRWLLGLGGGTAPMLWFRREPRQVGLAVVRRTRSWRIPPSPGETRMLDALGRYARRVERQGDADARLAMIVLRKRALSSAAALGCSLRRRRALLDVDSSGQILLPFEPDPGEVDTGDCDDVRLLAAPGLDDRASELSSLDAVIELAREAEPFWSKGARVSRLLRRTREPVLIFTEYRDTLEALVRRLEGLAPFVVLHGGMLRDARADAVARFTQGDARVLVATDVAAEGLNLQARCRLVVSLELPWSPSRLEQRAGRVDRIGQSRPVRVWTLTGASRHEAMVVAALARRAEAIRKDTADRPEPSDAFVPPAPVDRHCERVPDRTLRDGEVADLVERLRRLTRPRDNGQARPDRSNGDLQRGIIVVFTRQPTRAGDALEHVAVLVRLHRRLPWPPRDWLPHVASIALPVAERAFEGATPLGERLAARERELLAAASARATRTRWQPSFFDRRAERVVDAIRSEANRLSEAHETRIVELTSRHTNPAIEPVLAIWLG